MQHLVGKNIFCFHKRILPITEGLELRDLWSPFQPSAILCFYDFMNCTDGLTRDLCYWLINLNLNSEMVILILHRQWHSVKSEKDFLGSSPWELEQNRKGITGARGEDAGGGASASFFPAESFLVLVLGMVKLCTFADDVPSLFCFCFLFSGLVIILYVTQMGQKYQYKDSLVVNHYEPCGIQINRLSHIFFTSLDSHFIYTSQPSDK